MRIIYKIVAIVIFAAVSSGFIFNPLILPPQATSNPSIGTPTSFGSASSSPAGTTMTLTTSANIVAGNLSVIIFGLNANNNFTTNTVSDGTNSYTQAAVALNSTNTRVEIWYKENASAVGSGATVTATFSGSTGGANGGMGGIQVTGIISASSLDKTATNTASSSPNCTATTATLSQTNEVLFGGGTAIGGPTGYVGATGFTNLILPNVSGVFLAGDYQKVAATTAVAFAQVWNASSVRNACAVASFKGF